LQAAHAFLTLHQLGPVELGLILAAAFAAGLIDAVAGGGGLITTPVLLLMLPGAPVAGALATTKVSSIAGTTGAAIAYSRSVRPDPRILIPGMLCALPAAWLGARSVTYMDPSLLKPVILGVLIAMAAYVGWRPNLGALLWFAPSGTVLWVLALPMAVCNLLGGVLGSRFAVRFGNVWIRRVFLAVVMALIARLGWSLYQ
jgi:uncharacterized membrane protein YfcA